jgi:serpin B
MKFIGLLIVAMIVASCAVSDESFNVSTEMVSHSINEFTFDVLPLTGEENSFFSPFSISSALAMTYAGARGNTETEMAAVLHFPEEQRILHPSFYELNKELENRQQGEIKLNVANALWIDQTASLKRDYLNLVERYYAAGENRLDFIQQPEESRLKINRWIEEKTEDKIKDLLAEGDVTSDTRLILTNAIYFLAGWENPFNPDQTEKMAFYTTPEERIPADFMKRKALYDYYVAEDYRMIEIPYEKKELAMNIFLPTKGLPLSVFIDSFDYDQFNEALQLMETEEVHLQLPKFSFDAKYGLRNLFRELGMVEAFTPDADFTGMTEELDEFFIDDVIHQAFIEVGEEGTEAAAATAVVMRVTSIPEPVQEIVFKADRPFLFFIRDTGTGTILFSGTLYNPED